MTTQTRHDPQLAIDEQALEDGSLESLLESLADMKAQLADAKLMLDDYLDRLTLDGTYRVGRWRLVVEQRRRLGISQPKPKKARR